MPVVGARCRGDLRNFDSTSYWGPRLDSAHAKCRGISDRHYHTIPGSSFWIRCLSEGGSIDFQRQLFGLPADSRQSLRDFCPLSYGSEIEKKSGVGVPLWGEFNGEVETLAANFSPPNYSRAAVRGGLDAGARSLNNKT